MTRTTIKAEPQRILDRLPDDVDWDDVIYEFFVRREIEAGLADCEAGRTMTTDELRRELGLQP
jgi:hypothetical protein